MPEYLFTETKQIIYEFEIIAESEEEARQKYKRIDDSEKEVNSSRTTAFSIAVNYPDWGLED
jgi:hypothetical protein